MPHDDKSRATVEELAMMVRRGDGMTFIERELAYSLILSSRSLEEAQRDKRDEVEIDEPEAIMARWRADGWDAIRPSELRGDEAWRRNGVYVPVFEVENRLMKSAPSHELQITQAAGESADADAPRSQRGGGMAPDIASASGMESSQGGGRPPSTPTPLAGETPETDAIAAAEVGRDVHYRWQAYERLARQLERRVRKAQRELAEAKEAQLAAEEAQDYRIQAKLMTAEREQPSRCRRAMDLMRSMIGTWDKEQSKRTQSIADEPWHVKQAREIINGAQ